TSQDAIKLVKSSKPNLILMDIMIKGNEDGIHTASEINEFADIPIIFLTAYSDDDTLERAKVVEPYGYLIKPFDNRELFTTIEMSLYKHSMEVSVRENEENLRITLNSIGDAVISTDENGMVVKMNPIAEKLTGWKFEEAKGLPLQKIFFLIDATTREPIPNPVEKVFSSGNIIGLSNHTLLIAKDGTERNISDSAAPIKDSEGNIRGVVLVFSDVTESYNAKMKLQESEEKFRQLITTMEQGLAVHEVIYDKNGKVVDYRFLDINDSYTKLTGLKREIIIGKTVKEILPEIEDYWIEKFGQVVITGKPVEYENFAKELGKYYHTVAYRNRPNQFAVIVTDVTDRRIAEEELRIKEQAIASSINAIALADLDGKLIYVNKSFLELWGYKKENEVLGKSSLEFWQNPKEAKKVMSSVLEKGSFVGELVAKRRDKKLLDLFLTATIVYSSEGKPVQIMASFIDVTERRKVENELIASEEKFRLLVEKAPLGIYYSNFKGEFIYGNKAAEDLIGYKKEELLGKNFLQCGLLSTNEIPIAAKLLARSLLGKSTGPDQLKLIKKDGTTVEVEISTQVINVGNQKIIMGMAQDITARKKAEERINLMAELLDLSPASIIVHDFDGKILFANKISMKMHGYTEDEFIKLNLKDIDTPESAELIEERINIIKEKGELSFEVSHRRKDGSSFPLLVNTKKAKINDQQVLLSVSSDITEKKLKEEELRQKTEELDNYFTNALDLFCIANTDGYFIRLNKQWENILGYPLNELEGKKFLDYIHPEDLDATLEAISVLKGQEKLIGFTNRYRAKDGSYKFIEWRAYPAGERIYAAARDITDRKLAEDALRKSEEMFRSYVENAPDAILVVDDKGNYVMANKAACEMTGYSKDEILKMHIMDVTYPGDFEKGKTHFKNVVEKGEATDEVRYVTKNGEVRYWSVKAVKLNDTRFLGFQTDITEKKLSEIALKESEEMFRSYVENA
ncbi:MAG: PAS domain S-box protein, partial [Ignavibacteria bacterium]|nr:PAS domain S-box protein [Ignavibacteria bacterium]